MYKPYNRYMGRCPLRTFKSVFDYGFENKDFNNAIFLASADLYKEKNRNKDYNSRMRYALYKYWVRSATRCTPFGLFSGVFDGILADETKNVISKFQARFRLDSQYICGLINQIESHPAVKDRLKFFPNDSIYTVNNRIRYIEFDDAGDGSFVIQEVDSSKELKRIIEESKKGLTIPQLTKLICGKNVTNDDASSFINEIIESQLLQSELKFNVTGIGSIEKLICVLEKNKSDKTVIKKLRELKHLVETLSCDNLLGSYEKLNIDLPQFQFDSKTKCLIQADANILMRQSTLAESLADAISDCIDFVIRLVPPKISKMISDFAKSFYEKYETQEIPLMLALDPDLGVSFPVDSIADYSEPLISDLPILQQKKSPITLSHYEKVVLNKLFHSGNYNEVFLDNDDIEDFIEIDEKKLPTTIGVLFRTHKDLIDIIAIGGTTASSVLGRFCYINENINVLAHQICEYERTENPDVCLAEIAHLPNSKMGNVIKHPAFRDVEIQCLSQSDGVTKIPLSDLMISVRNGKITLRAKSSDREIWPYLSNAHSFDKSDCIVYNFLCSLQYYNSYGLQGLSMDNILTLLGFSPRIRYKKCILAKRMWKVLKSDINNAEDDKYSAINNWRGKNRVPSQVVICDDDNELYINFEDTLSLEVFNDFIKKHDCTTIMEFLFDEEHSDVVDEMGNPYCSEYYLPFYKS